MADLVNSDHITELKQANPTKGAHEPNRNSKSDLLSLIPSTSLPTSEDAERSKAAKKTPVLIKSSGKTTSRLILDESDGKRWPSKLKSLFIKAKPIEQSSLPAMEKLSVKPKPKPKPPMVSKLQVLEGKRYYDVPGPCYPLPVDDDELD